MKWATRGVSPRRTAPTRPGAYAPGYYLSPLRG